MAAVAAAAPATAVLCRTLQKFQALRRHCVGVLTRYHGNCSGFSTTTLGLQNNNTRQQLRHSSSSNSPRRQSPFTLPWFKPRRPCPTESQVLFSQPATSIRHNTTHQRQPRGVLRFYRTVTLDMVMDCASGASPADASTAAAPPPSWRVLLDGRPLTTPGGHPCVVPTQMTAYLMAAEWDQQATYVQFELMPINSLVIQTLDLVRHGDSRPRVEAETLKFLKTDVTVMHHESDAALRSRQNATMRPIHAALEHHFQLPYPLRASSNFKPVDQHPENRDILASLLKRKNDWELSCLFCVVRHLKSYLLGVALLENLISTDTALTAASVEETYQREHWGHVEGSHDLDVHFLQMWLNAVQLLQRSLQ